VTAPRRSDPGCMSNQSDSLAPLVIAFVLVYALAVLICGVLVDGTIALAFVAAAVMAIAAALVGVEVFRKLDDGD
jgi:membrane protein implicated in regulation of membrane protease activity